MKNISLESFHLRDHLTLVIIIISLMTSCTNKENCSRDLKINNEETISNYWTLRCKRQR